MSSLGSDGGWSASVVSVSAFMVSWWRDFFIEGYLFIASIYFGASFAMSRYSQWLERRLKIDSAR